MPQQQTKKNSGRFRAALATIGLLILTKLKWVIGLLKFTKFASMFISLAISLGTYAVFFGWKFAAVLLYLMFVHEMGHLVAAKQKGIATSPAIFIPFLGAAIAMKERPKNAADEAYLAYGGPLAGLLSFLPAVPLYAWTHDSVWGLMIYLGALLNLFNLLPVSPLDGGRIVGVLSTKIWFLGLLAVAALLFWQPSAILILILLFGFFTWWNRARENFQAEQIRYMQQRHRNYLGELRQMLEELFFMRIDEGGMPDPVLNSDVRFFHLRQVRMKIGELKEELKERSGFLIPFLQDEKKLKRKRLEIDLEYERKKEAFLDGMSTEYDDLKAKIAEAEAAIPRMEKELERMKTYYQAPASTKWKVLVLYLALAAVLSFFFFYGERIASAVLMM
ncbi:MAG TPA: site-2 protease family protein [Bacillales bacterium]|nr:site-2 protease family protein [Bacillales bacterium]